MANYFARESEIIDIVYDLDKDRFKTFTFYKSIYYICYSIYYKCETVIVLSL